MKGVHPVGTMNVNLMSLIWFLCTSGHLDLMVVKEGNRLIFIYIIIPLPGFLLSPVAGTCEQLCSEGINFSLVVLTVGIMQTQQNQPQTADNWPLSWCRSGCGKLDFHLWHFDSLERELKGQTTLDRRHVGPQERKSHWVRPWLCMTNSQQNKNDCQVLVWGNTTQLFWFVALFSLIIHVCSVSVYI